MAIGWLSILKAVPWTDVVSNAPKVADGAKKLWETVARRKSPSGNSAAATTGASAPDGVEARIAELAGELDRVQQEMLASSQLLKSLAEQNAQLVRRVYWQSRLLVVVGLLAAAGLALALLR